MPSEILTSNSSNGSEKRDSGNSQGCGDVFTDLEKGTALAVPELEPVSSDANSTKEITETITIPLHEYPRGYPRQAAFQSSESSWSIYRAFNYLHARVILELQDDLRDLESQLKRLDNSDFKNGDERRLMSRKDDRRYAKRDNAKVARVELLEKIRTKLINYDEVLAKARELNAFQRPSNRDYSSFRTWFWNEKPLSYPPEEQFIKRKENLISLRHGREWSSFDGFVESCVRKMHCKLTQRIFTTKELREKTNDECIHYYSQSRIDKLVGVIVTFVIFVLLILPVVLMYKLTSVGDRNSTIDAVGIMVVFTLLFSAAMSLLTKAKRHELFAASAAYCAVLVVFITNFNDGRTN